MANMKLEVLHTFTYDRPEVRNGYTDQTLCVELSNPAISIGSALSAESGTPSGSWRRPEWMPVFPKF